MSSPALPVLVCQEAPQQAAGSRADADAAPDAAPAAAPDAREAEGQPTYEALTRELHNTSTRLKSCMTMLRKVAVEKGALADENVALRAEIELLRASSP
ncbi:hypothetical protein T484DRAFT_1888470, partial [Baffinella frigidus]